MFIYKTHFIYSNCFNSRYSLIIRFFFKRFARTYHPLQFVPNTLQEITIRCSIFPTNCRSFPSVAVYFNRLAGKNHPLRFIPRNLQELSIRRWTGPAFCGNFLYKTMLIKYCSLINPDLTKCN